MRKPLIVWAIYDKDTWRLLGYMETRTFSAVLLWAREKWPDTNRLGIYERGSTSHTDAECCRAVHWLGK